MKSPEQLQFELEAARPPLFEFGDPLVRALVVLRIWGAGRNAELARRAAIPSKSFYDLVYKLRQHGLAIRTNAGTYDVSESGRESADALIAQAKDQGRLFGR